jgi:GNAT superfamily N-acetyltransferase
MTGIRQAEPNDASRLAELGVRTFTDTFGHLYPPEDLASYLASAYAVERVAADLRDARKRMWVAEHDGVPVGFALAGPCHLPHAEVTARCGELERVYLLRSAQGSGLGTKLLASAFEWLLADGPRDLWISVYSENHGAQRLYARHGFEVVGEYRFRVGRCEDRELMLRRRPG